MLDKRKIKKDYKNQLRPAGVYAVINQKDKIVFLGKTRNPGNVCYRLNIELERGTHPHKKMVEDYEKIGKNNFDVKICDKINTEKLDETGIVEKLDELYTLLRSEFEQKGYDFYNKFPGH